MSDVTAPSSPTRSAGRRPAAAFLTVTAAVAGLAAGRVLGQSGSEPLVVLFIASVALCSLVAWITTAPGPDDLTASGREAFRVELDRGRRHRRTFAMARLEFREPPPAGSAPDEGAGGIAGATIRLIGSSLRITDHAWPQDGDVVILLPESDGATALAFAERVRSTVPGRFTERIGIAAFPDDGLTSEALFDALERSLRGADLPSPMVRTTVAGVADLVGAPAAAGDPVESGVG